MSTTHYILARSSNGNHYSTWAFTTGERRDAFHENVRRNRDAGHTVEIVIQQIDDATGKLILEFPYDPTMEID